MDKVGSVKRYIIIGLVIIEGFVWTVSSPVDAWSMGIIGGADGPTAIFLSNGSESEALGAEQIANKEDHFTDEGKQKADEAEQAAYEEQTRNLLKEAESKGLLILVNKKNPIDKDYIPEDLEEIKYFATDRTSSSRYMREEAASAFHKLVESAALEEIEILMTTAYRSYDFQAILYNSYVENEGQEAADKFSAKPGQSEHQTGLSVDVSSASVDYKLTTSFRDTKEGKWLAENAHKYGFIIRYPEGKEDITGYIYEPWHIRYVGLQAAGEIYEQNITLEEYLDEYYN